jgi:hypothetical protein
LSAETNVSGEYSVSIFWVQYSPDDGGSTFLSNIGIRLQSCMVSQPRTYNKLLYLFHYNIIHNQSKIHRCDVLRNNTLSFNTCQFNIIFDRTTKEIEYIIKSVKSKNSCGYDEISVKILKISCLFITAPLNYICNRSVLSGSFPTQLKYCY